MSVMSTNKTGIHVSTLDTSHVYTQKLYYYKVNSQEGQSNYVYSPLTKVMKSPSDASAHNEGKRHQNGMKIDDNAVKVTTCM